ncbi:hypothetical protein AKJ09_03838 [Labilithrix luteola]|uniref:Uncharacterized protein n=1 Tax=Labilithrix luteola TaxID=1391654 RepID=A0A0K1PVM3_9BACT|nr:hypothetical protein AKJ09_03838 [Labilithrix luteola]
MWGSLPLRAYLPTKTSRGAFMRQGKEGAKTDHEDLPEPNACRVL